MSTIRLRNCGLVLFLSLALSSHAVTLEDVRRTLASLDGTSALKVRIDTSSLRIEGKNRTQSTSSSVAEDDGELLRMVHRKSQLPPPRTERGPRPDSSVGPSEAVELMNYAPAMLELLEGASLKKVSQASFEGTATTLLEIVPKREVRNPKLERFVNKFGDVLLLHVAAGGVPIAAERTQSIKASLLVIRFQASSKERRRFVRVADRLLVARQTVDVATSGLGQNESGSETRTVVVVQ